jgi:hypothetical protein
MFGKILEVGFWKLLLALATMIGAFGGFPDQPKAFSALAQYQLVQWLLVFVLIYQGGGGEDPILSGVLTVAAFFGYKAIRFFESSDDVDDLVL